ncbi:MAG: PKD domain-containing protein [Bacteroidota bacterium]
MKLRYLPLAWIFLSMSLADLAASHIEGFTLRYECVNNCVYRFYFGRYYECSAPAIGFTPPFDPNSPINYPSASLFFSTGPANQGPNCGQPTKLGSGLAAWLEVSPLCPSVNTTCNSTLPAPLAYPGYVYVEEYLDYDMCGINCDWVRVSHISCCRGVGYTNPLNGTSEAIHIAMDMNVQAGLCNHSPIDTVQQTAFICDGQTSILEYGMMDPDGDSLVYYLGDCTRDSLSSLNYAPGYSGIQPLGQDWQVELDSATGRLTVVPAPGGLEKVNICVYTNEYRNDSLISRYVRDLTIRVLDCGTQLYPSFDSLLSLSGGSFQQDTFSTLCGEIPLALSWLVNDPNPTDTLQAGLRLTASDPLPGGLTLTSTGVNPMVVELAGSPDSAGMGKSYSLLLEAWDHACPVNGMGYLPITLDIGPSCLNPLIAYPSCTDSSGIIDLSPAGAFANPVSILWSTGDTTTVINNLPPGIYWVSLTDSLGNTLADTFDLNTNDLQLVSSQQAPGCNLSDGSISLSVSGGTAPYSFGWTTGDTMASVQNLPEGGYGVDILDANQCLLHTVFVLSSDDSCLNQISGTVYHDLNLNCQMDPGEFPVPNTLVMDQLGNGIFTDAAGQYELGVGMGTTTLGVYLPPGMVSFCPGGGTVTVNFASLGNVQSGLDFSLESDSTQDLAVNVAPLATAFDTSLSWFQAVNFSYVPLAAKVQAQSDSLLNLVVDTAYPLYDTFYASTQTYEWDMDTLDPYQAVWHPVPIGPSSFATPGDTAWLRYVILPLSSDSAPENNYDSVGIEILASYDPNDKLVTPRGIGPEGFIQAKDSLLQYTIRFQNTGTAPATYVQIRDTLPATLNPFTLKMLGGSHPYTAKVVDGHILEVTHSNIFLPDSLSDPLGSQGFIAFTVRLHPNLPMGTEIRNRAGIYFDFNAPVITNYALNTLYQPPELSLQSPDSLCEGDLVPAFITTPGMPPYLYSWQDGSTFQDSALFHQIPATQSGWYVVRATDAFGFEAVDSLYIEVEALPQAAFQYTLLSSTQLQFQNQSTDAQNYLWDFGDGNQSTNKAPTHQFPGPGTYFIQLMVQNACGADTSVQEVQLYTTPLAPSWDKHWLLYPVPVAESLKLMRTASAGEPFSLEILDARGRRIFYREGLREDRFTLSTETWPSGLYLVRISVGGNSFSKNIWRR